ncbi:extensin family protein [uncultured Algimonas sp.]|uniref:extensin-like domain-containing protein n=1 Tax=uncultured Algimonas sp. TaxID=1547920 RepID=UPI002635662A|nr:extensin family protein [uncultured Algimonas sp.]
MRWGGDDKDWDRIGRWLRAALVLWILIAVLWTFNRIIPNQHLPWRPLDPDAPIGMATRGQLLRLSVSPPEVCMDLARDIEAFRSIPSEPKTATEPCGWDVARLVYGSGATVLSPGEANMQCPLSVATFLWLREVDALARDRFGQPLVKVHHMGSFSCRRVRGNSSGRWSEHAFANAWDVAAFELADGRLIRVLSGWDGEDKDDRRFLRDVRQEACRVFNVVLSPDYNAAHADHFHLDMGPYTSCR